MSGTSKTVNVTIRKTHCHHRKTPILKFRLFARMLQSNRKSQCLKVEIDFGL